MYWPERPFRGIRPVLAAVVLVFLAVLTIASAAMPGADIAAPDLPVAASQADTGESGKSDLDLYRRIGNRVAAGDDYHAAAANEHRAANYPMRPFFVVRLPTLAWFYAFAGDAGVLAVTMLLLFANAFAWSARADSAGERVATVLLVLVAGAALINPDIRLLHDMWAGLLLSLSLALWRPGRWWPALLLAALALFIRELALPFVLLWVAFAIFARRWREVAMLGAVLVLFAVGLAAHADAVAAIRLPGDLASPGWSGMSGPAVYFEGLHMLTMLVLAPAWISGPVAVLGLFGFLSTGGRTGWFAALWLIGLVVMMALFARAGNWYWAALALPLPLVGLALAPRGFADLILSLRRGAAAGRT
ncbi:hypothetical protein [Croceicoccus bisphenolivorans]|uniref:hypothetical protein n=1 Tax=Croceicoccus bisphenolivorans TaxID=1783232 RepID=UPI000837A67D|nr:hypothetical protein [Croceicoccus bisphenolivorans]